MNEALEFALFFLAFWLMVYLLNRKFSLSRYGLDVRPFLIKWESKRFRNLLYRCSCKWRKVWKIFSWASIFIGVGLMVLALTFLLWNLIRAFILNELPLPVTLVIPGVTLRLFWLPYFLTAVILTILIHEAAHGIVAINEGISVKSAGALLLAIFPGGFVEPDEKELSVASPKAKIKVFSAGSASNMVAGLIVFLLLSGLFVQSPSGLVVLETLDGGPLYRAGIGFWDIIYAINGHEIHTLQDLRDFMSNVKPGEEITIRTSKGDFVITAESSPEVEGRVIIGLVSSIPYYPSKLGLGHPIDTHLYLTLNWLFIVLVSVAAFNMLPIPYLDGDKLFQCLAEKFPKVGSTLRRFFNILSLFLLLANIAIY